MKRDFIVAGMVLSLICLFIVIKNFTIESFFVTFLGCVGWAWFYIDMVGKFRREST